MSNPTIYQVNLLTLADDLQTAFAAQRQCPSTAVLIEIQGSGRLAKDFADLLVESINNSSVSVMALVRDDLLIQFLVSSINLRCSQTEVKAFKTSQAAKEWLIASPSH